VVRSRFIINICMITIAGAYASPVGGAPGAILPAERHQGGKALFIIISIINLFMIIVMIINYLYVFYQPKGTRVVRRMFIIVCININILMIVIALLLFLLLLISS